MTHQFPGNVYEAPIERLDLSERVLNWLKGNGIQTVGEVMELLAKNDPSPGDAKPGNAEKLS